MRRACKALVRSGLLLCLLARPAYAAGQTSVSGALESDDRFRGISISHGQPDARLDLSYDHDSGLYGGLSLVAAPGRDRSAALTHYTAYAGFVSRPVSGLSWEGGISHTHIADDSPYDYDELYAGVISGAVSARLSYSPRYYGHDAQTVYADISGGRQLSRRLRVFAHAGWLTRVSGSWPPRSRYDVSAGIATTIRVCELRLTVTQAPSLYAWGRNDGGTALVLSATRAF